MKRLLFGLEGFNGASPFISTCYPDDWTVDSLSTFKKTHLIYIVKTNQTHVPMIRLAHKMNLANKCWLPATASEYVEYHEILLMEEIWQTPVKVGRLFYHFREFYTSTVVGLGIPEQSTVAADVPIIPCQQQGQTSEMMSFFVSPQRSASWQRCQNWNTKHHWVGTLLPFVRPSWGSTRLIWNPQSHYKPKQLKNITTSCLLFHKSHVETWGSNIPFECWNTCEALQLRGPKFTFGARRMARCHNLKYGRTILLVGWFLGKLQL